MTDRAEILPSPAISSLVRHAMRRSPSHAVDHNTPDRIADLLRELDQAETRQAVHVAGLGSGEP